MAQKAEMRAINGQNEGTLSCRFFFENLRSISSVFGLLCYLRLGFFSSSMLCGIYLF